MSAAPPLLKLGPIDMGAGLRRLAIDAIKRAITEMDIYRHQGEIRLDERQLSQDLGVSRTRSARRSAISSRKGLVRSVRAGACSWSARPRHEILEMILVWAAIEGMAARLAAERASDGDLAMLRASVRRVRGRP